MTTTNIPRTRASTYINRINYLRQILRNHISTWESKVYPELQKKVRDVSSLQYHRRATRWIREYMLATEIHQNWSREEAILMSIVFMLYYLESLLLLGGAIIKDKKIEKDIELGRDVVTSQMYFFENKLKELGRNIVKFFKVNQLHFKKLLNEETYYDINKLVLEQEPGEAPIGDVIPGEEAEAPTPVDLGDIFGGGGELGGGETPGGLISKEEELGEFAKQIQTKFLSLKDLISIERFIFNDLEKDLNYLKELFSKAQLYTLNRKRLSMLYILEDIVDSLIKQTKELKKQTEIQGKLDNLNKRVLKNIYNITKTLINYLNILLLSKKLDIELEAFIDQLKKEYEETPEDKEAGIIAKKQKETEKELEKQSKKELKTEALLNKELELILEQFIDFDEKNLLNFKVERLQSNLRQLSSHCRKNPSDIPFLFRGVPHICSVFNFPSKYGLKLTEEEITAFDYAQVGVDNPIKINSIEDAFRLFEITSASKSEANVKKALLVLYKLGCEPNAFHLIIQDTYREIFSRNKEKAIKSIKIDYIVKVLRKLFEESKLFRKTLEHSGIIAGSRYNDILEYSFIFITGQNRNKIKNKVDELLNEIYDGNKFFDVLINKIANNKDLKNFFKREHSRPVNFKEDFEKLMSEYDELTEGARRRINEIISILIWLTRIAPNEDILSKFKEKVKDKFGDNILLIIEREAFEDKVSDAFELGLNRKIRIPNELFYFSDLMYSSCNDWLSKVINEFDNIIKNKIELFNKRLREIEDKEKTILSLKFMQRELVYMEEAEEYDKIKKILDDINRIEKTKKQLSSKSDSKTIGLFGALLSNLIKNLFDSSFKDLGESLYSEIIIKYVFSYHWIIVYSESVRNYIGKFKEEPPNLRCGKSILRKSSVLLLFLGTISRLLIKPLDTILLPLILGPIYYLGMLAFGGNERVLAGIIKRVKDISEKIKKEKKKKET